MKAEEARSFWNHPNIYLDFPLTLQPTVYKKYLTQVVYLVHFSKENITYTVSSSSELLRNLEIWIP